MWVLTRAHDSHKRSFLLNADSPCVSTMARAHLLKPLCVGVQACVHYTHR